MSLHADVLGLIRRHALLGGVRTVVVGLSGGPDSACLLDLLVSMAERGEIDVAVHATHLNHGLRGDECDADERAARSLADRIGVPITVEQADVPALRAEEGGSVEEVARRARYAFLASVAETVGAEAVAVGHHAGDQIETVLHRLVRGTGLRGIRGMALSRLIGPESVVRLVRPLLETRRTEILAHLEARGLSYREDSSNADPSFTRNRIRNELLPLIEAEYNPGFGAALLRLSRAATDAYELVADVAHTAVVDCVSGHVVDIREFTLAHGAVRPLLIDAGLDAVNPAHPQLDAKHYDAIVDLALDGRPGSRLDLPGGLVAMRARDVISFAEGLPDAAPRAVRVGIVCPGETEVPGAGAGATLRTEVVDRAEFDFESFRAAKTRYDEVVDADAVGEPLVLRSLEKGDRFRPLGLGGTKKVGDFLTDLKVPVDERARTLLLTAAGRPVWLVGYRLDEGVKVTEETARVLRVSARFDQEQRQG